jgi:hypothetical protein
MIYNPEDCDVLINGKKVTCLYDVDINNKGEKKMVGEKMEKNENAKENSTKVIKKDVLRCDSCSKYVVKVKSQGKRCFSAKATKEDKKKVPNGCGCHRRVA